MRNLKYVLCAIVALGFLSVMTSPATAVTIGDNPCIDLVKTGPETAVPGQIITFHFKVTNCGNAGLYGHASVYDPLLNGDPNVPIWSESMEPGDVREFDMTYTVPADYSSCTLLNDAWAIGLAYNYIDPYNLPPVEVEDNDALTDWNVLIGGANCGVGTPGYWKNHPDAWPVDSITIGGITYAKDIAIGEMQTSVKGDKTFTMFDALVAAKLNVAMGNPSGCIEDTIGDADDWMAVNGPVGSGVEASSSAWKEGEPLYNKLDAYNNGLLCAPHRD